MNQKWMIVVAATALAVWLSFVLVMCSAYCDSPRHCAFWARLNTGYAEGYSEEAFARLEVGMSQAEVDAIMCPPLRVSEALVGPCRIPGGYFFVDYTDWDSGACPFDHVGWNYRSVVISNGVVTRIYRRTLP